MKNYNQLEITIIERLFKQDKSITFIYKELKRIKPPIYIEINKHKTMNRYFVKNTQFATELIKMNSRQNVVKKIKIF